MDVDAIPLLSMAPGWTLADCADIVERHATVRPHFQECHGTAEEVMEELGGSEEGPYIGWKGFRARLDSDSRGVYKVDFRVPADDLHPRWDHSFAVVKVQDDILIYQAFQGRYSLSDYVNHIAGPHSVRFAAVGGAPLARDAVQDFLTGVEGMLARFEEGKPSSGFLSCCRGEPDYDDLVDKFHASAVRLFGAPANLSVNDRGVLERDIRRNSVQIRWRRAPLKQ